ncbi:(5-formylfuran-3-yl)methyl phosphate synthase [Derxia lacustris]|uniref:(5-formylfuran-3-yl)methyl phosphate synthase n=1 Tax=Derxia lacustris TaxID=764842 RepID=UPI000A1716B4|nr:(5-formylfuran-3-yl)methyl phosphate synthase [Derxia lacustris]
MRILVSVRDVAEARLAAAAGVDFIDCKEPAQGALGGLDPATIAAVVAELRAAGAGHTLVSATVGDWPVEALAAALAQARAVASCGVDYVKVGLWPGPAGADWLAALAREPYAVVPVLIADAGIDLALAEQAGALGFPAVMADTADKRGGSLAQRLGSAGLAAFVAAVARGAAGPSARSPGAARADAASATAVGTRVLVGLAGALRAAELAEVAAAGADFAGFRSAVCAGDRAGQLDAGRLARLVAAARAEPLAA